MLADERIGAVLQFARRIAFCVDIRRLFQLESALTSDGIVNPAAKIQKTRSRLVSSRERRHLRVPWLQCRLNDLGNPSKLVDQASDRRGVDAVYSRTFVERKQIEHCKLAGKT